MALPDADVHLHATGTTAWPAPAEDPDEAQAMLYEIAWDSTRPDKERALAARGAIACAREIHGPSAGALPPGDEAEGHLADAVVSNDEVLDAVTELGPVPYPQSRAFGSMLAGRLYDTRTTQRDRLLAVQERFLADQVLPPESEASRLAADDRRR